MNADASISVDFNNTYDQSLSNIEPAGGRYSELARLPLNSQPSLKMLTKNLKGASSDASFNLLD